MAALPATELDETVPSAPGWLSGFGVERLIAYVVLIVSIGFSAYYLVPQATIRVQPLNDNVLHIEAARQAAASLSAGKDPTDSWLAQIGLGYPLFHHYQHLEYIP
ncbi:MAG TPA: hypothetical protein VNE17_11555, partial [Nitrolancea sp.]|nr:hypothetical protein [Nitrolancea sp.]